jgi:hypothetical protein
MQVFSLENWSLCSRHSLPHSARFGHCSSWHGASFSEAVVDLFTVVAESVETASEGIDDAGKVLDEPDVEKLLARYAKVNRPVLDLGVIAGADRHALAPFQPEVRARWNAAHPAHRVSVPEAKKTARKGGAK